MIWYLDFPLLVLHGLHRVCIELRTCFQLRGSSCIAFFYVPNAIKIQKAKLLPGNVLSPS